MATYTRLGPYLLANELASDATGRISRGLTLVGSGFDRHYLVRTFSDELVELGLAKLADGEGVLEQLAGARGYGSNYQFEAGKTPYVVCDYVPGRSLAQVLRKTREEQIPLGVDHALSVLQGMAQAILQLHGKGIHHGILSPHSVWVGFEGSTLLLDAPYAAVLQTLLPKAHAMAAELAPYRAAGSATPLQQDLYALGSVLYELLTLDKLPAGKVTPELLAAATLKAAQEEAPIPGEIIALLNRLLMLGTPFESVPAFNADLERVLYDGEYSPTTFNMAFFMHTLFRDESDSDTQAMKADQGADFTPFLTSGAGSQQMLEGGSNGNVLKYSIIGGAILLAAFGVLVLRDMGNARRNADLQAKIVALDRENAENNAKLLDLNKAQEQARVKEAQLAKLALEGKTAEERAKAKKDLEEAKAMTEQLARQREEALKKRQEISAQSQTIAQSIPQPAAPKAEAPKPVAAAPAPTPAPAQTPTPAPAPAAAPAAQHRAADVELPVTIATQTMPVAPRVSKKFLPQSLRTANVIKVAVKVQVDEQGHPIKVLIVNGVDGTWGYNESAQSAAMNSGFNPATRNGKPIKGWINMDYNFPIPKN
jgi:hypothetical protein